MAENDKKDKLNINEVSQNSIKAFGDIAADTSKAIKDNKQTFNKSMSSFSKNIEDATNKCYSTVNKVLSSGTATYIDQNILSSDPKLNQENMDSRKALSKAMSEAIRPYLKNKSTQLGNNSKVYFDSYTNTNKALRNLSKDLTRMGLSYENHNKAVAAYSASLGKYATTIKYISEGISESNRLDATMRDIGSFGVEEDELKEILLSALSISNNTGNQDINDIANLFKQVLANTLNVSAKSSESIVASIVETSQATGISSEEIANVFSHLYNNSKDKGASPEAFMQELSDSLSLLSRDFNISASSVAAVVDGNQNMSDSIASIGSMSAILGSGDKGLDLYSKVSQVATSGNVKGLTLESMNGNIGEILATVSQDELESIFGPEYLDDINKIIAAEKKYGNAYSSIQEQIRNSNIATAMANENNKGNDFDKLIISFKNLKVAIGNIFAPSFLSIAAVIGVVANSVSFLINKLDFLFKPLAGLITLFMMIKMAMLSAKIAMLTLTFSTTLYNEVLSKQAMKLHLAAIKTFFYAQKQLFFAIVTKVASVAMTIFNFILGICPLSPLGLAIIAVIAVFVILYKRVAVIREIFEAIGDWIKKVGKVIGKFFGFGDSGGKEEEGNKEESKKKSYGVSNNSSGQSYQPSQYSPPKSNNSYQHSYSNSSPNRTSSPSKYSNASAASITVNLNGMVVNVSDKDLDTILFSKRFVQAVERSLASIDLSKANKSIGTGMG